jgi:LacI family transcriptional regulator
MESASFEKASFLQLQPRRFAFILTHERLSLPDIRMMLMQGLNERYQSRRSQVIPVFMPDYASTDEEFQQWVQKSELLVYDGVFIPPMLPPGVEHRLLGLPVPRILLNFPPIGAKLGGRPDDLANCQPGIAV